MKMSRPANNPLLHILIIITLGLIAYSNTFDVPFQWDENHLIVDNPIVKDLGYYADPSALKAPEYRTALINRYAGYFTFALNYQTHGLDVMGYHIFNIVIHLLNALLLYMIIALSFRTPYLSGSNLKEHSGYVALFTALLFVAHPVQTEAVTYIFQRLASLAAFFYLMSLFAYIKVRLTKERNARAGYYLLSLIAAVLAMKTKENAFTLPAVITLYEFIFFSGPLKRRIIRLAPLLLTMLIIPLSIVGLDKPALETLGALGAVPRGFDGFSRAEYLFTQFRVVATYIRLLFIPVGQNIDHDFVLSRSFLEPGVLASFAFLFCLFAGGLCMLLRSRQGNAALRLSGFGILWFFVALSVESSVIPIPMLINEYRVYLPSAGFFTAVAASAALLFAKVRSEQGRRVFISALVAVPLVLTAATYARNKVWQSEISLWEDVVKKSPLKPRGHNNLGNYYYEKGAFDKAKKHFEAAMELTPNNPDLMNNMGNVYYVTGDHERALESFHAALGIKPEFMEALNNIGNVYKALGDYDRAVEHFKAALALRPGLAKVHNNLGSTYTAAGQFDLAMRHFEAALKAEPGMHEAHNNIGNAYLAMGMSEAAIGHYITAIRLKPDSAPAHYNLGTAYFKKGDMELALREFETVLKLNPNDLQARRYINKILNRPHGGAPARGSD